MFIIKFFGHTFKSSKIKIFEHVKRVIKLPRLKSGFGNFNVSEEEAFSVLIITKLSKRITIARLVGSKKTELDWIAEITYFSTWKAGVYVLLSNSQAKYGINHFQY
ncbi:MAG: hypothetical protein WCX88_04210 [Patescibacteria group bacterium]